MFRLFSVTWWKKRLFPRIYSAGGYGCSYRSGCRGPWILTICGSLLSVIEDTRDRAMILVLLRTGMRIGELLNTKVTDVHLKERRIEIYEGEKNRLGRVVYLSDDAVMCLAEVVEGEESTGGISFL